MAKALLQGIPVVLKDKCSYFVQDMSIQKWDRFSKITIACANFEETFTGVVLKEYCGWKFVQSELTELLDFKEYENTDRIEIIPLFNGNWSRYAGDLEYQGDTVYNQMRNIVGKIVGDEKFIYTTNSYRGVVKNGDRISYNPHGLNGYMDYKCAVALFSYNPSPWQNDLLKSFSKKQGLASTTLSDAFIVSKYLEPVFQLCLRTVIRSNVGTEKVRLIVPDWRAADYLKSRYLKDATINSNYIIMFDDERKARKTRKTETKPRKRKESFTSMFNLTAKEQSALSYFQKKKGIKLSINEPAHIKMVSEWVSEKRKVFNK